MIRPMLEITTTPARYEYQVTRAKLQISQERPTVERRVSRATLNMKRQSGRFDMNTVRRRSDMGMKGVVDRANYEADLGIKQSRETTGTYSEMGNQLAKFHEGANIPDTLYSQSMKHVGKGDLVLVPVSPIDIHYIPASLAVDFNPGQMQADWNVGRAKLDFVPGNFALDFQQYASLSIEYIGGFNYVPPSADPDYEARA
ncbi:DUF6470 family protein [Ruminococcaceae bacterium OttesenSCG-928-D13]|nr:DUF6470 family protein [Ruminococcaceae bacterium OttesenSCG-928-D13]